MPWSMRLRKVRQPLRVSLSKLCRNASCGISCFLRVVICSSPWPTVKALRQRPAYVKLKLTRKCGSIYAACVIARLALRGCFPQTVLSGNLYAAVSFRFHTLFVTREAE